MRDSAYFFQSYCRCRRARFRAEFFADMFDMLLHRSPAYSAQQTDFDICFSLCQPIQNLRFAFRYTERGKFFGREIFLRFEQ